MNWINLRTEILRSPAFTSCKPGAIETWLRVMAYCCEQENGGCIENGKGWNDRSWMASCGVSSDEIEAAYPLIYDDGVAVFVEAYPIEREEEVKAKRKSGRRGGLKSGRSRASRTASSTPRTEGEGEGERKDKGKSNNKARASSADEVNEFFDSVGLPLSDAEYFFFKCEGNGWTNGGKPIKDWKMTVRSHKAGRFFPSQKNGSQQEIELQVKDRTDEMVDPPPGESNLDKLKAMMAAISDQP